MNLWLMVFGMALVAVAFIFLICLAIVLPSRLVNSYYDKKELDRRQRAFDEAREDMGISPADKPGTDKTEPQGEAPVSGKDGDGA